MVDKDEIIKELLRLGILFNIGEGYMLTEKYKELLMLDKTKILPEPVKPKAKLDEDVLLNPRTNGSDWPMEILESKGRIRATILMDVCGIPTKSASGYLLRSLDGDAVNILGNIIENSDIQPSVFIACVKEYYETQDMPVGFKRLLTEGAITGLYLDYIADDFDPNKTTNTWQ